MATRWGICSAGKISNDFVTAVKTLSENDHQVIAVAARSLESAQKFAKRFDIKRAYGSYQELANDPNIDVVYIGSIHTEHHKLSLLFLNAGKHILVEKPITLNLKQATEIFDLAKEKKLFAMEGLWTRFFPLFTKVREAIESGKIGAVKLVTSDHSIYAPHVDRLYNKTLGGGAILDLGVYPVQFACMLFNNEKPEKIVASGFTHEHSGVDETASITLLYKDNRMAQLTTSFMAQGTNMSTISGTDGLITIMSPSHAPTKCCINGQEHEFPLPETSGQINFRNSVGLAYEANAVRESLLKGELENPSASHAHSLLIMTIMEESLRQLGVTYEDVGSK